MKTKPIILLLLTVHFSFLSFSQIISGQLTEKGTGQPIPYANIGVMGKNTGTCADAKGLFELKLDQISDRDSLSITCIGFERSSVLIRELKREAQSSGLIRIELSPKSYQLKEVVIKPVKTRTYILGNSCKPDSPYGNAFYSTSLGTEIGVEIKLPRRKSTAYLKNLRFFVGKFTFNRFPVRINLYTLKDGIPHENILREHILIDITSTGEYLIDLTKYHLILHEDFFISLEYYRIADLTQGSLIFCAVDIPQGTRGNGYYRLTSQADWIREIVANTGLSVEVECAK